MTKSEIGSQPTLINFRTAAVVVSQDTIIATFHDGKQNHFWFEGKDDDYPNIARWAGYSDNWRDYAVDHELTHHFVADNLGWKHSWSVHTDIRFEEPWPDHIAWEEHIVNNLQRYTMLGCPDPYGVLPLVFGERLDDLRLQLTTLYKIVLDRPAKIVYTHETGKIDVS